MSHELDGVASCFNLVESKARPLRERLGLRLARVGVQRGARAFQALRFLLEDPAPESDDASLNPIVESALGYFNEELLLTETTLQLRFHDAPIAIKADARLLSLAIQACAGMLIALIEASGRGGGLQISTGVIGDTAHCELSQDAYRMGPEQIVRLTDLEWTDRPGGIPAGIGLAAAARIAQAHGGHLEARRKDPSGCVMKLILPRG
jgi:nitrogen fixation/metabolism regulation signal transduction histidine kinase